MISQLLPNKSPTKWHFQQGYASNVWLFTNRYKSCILPPSAINPETQSPNALPTNLAGTNNKAHTGTDK